MSGARRGRNRAEIPANIAEEGAAGGSIQQSPPNANRNLGEQRSPPPLYAEALNQPNVMREPGLAFQPNPVPQNIPGGPVEGLNVMFQQMINAFNLGQQAIINAIRENNIPQNREERVLGPAPVEPQNVPNVPFNANPPFANPQGFRGQRPQGAPQPQARTQHLKSTDAKIPQYAGSYDSKTPYDFIIELEKYQEIVGYTQFEMIQYVIPLALIQDAYNWYRYEPPFQNWNEFKIRLRAEFQALGYHEELKRELDNRSQAPTESLTSYIRIIQDYYERIGEPVVELSIVNRVLKKMHPEYRQALLGKDIRTLNHLKLEAHAAQEMIKNFRTYRPPPTFGSLEPSLVRRPLMKVQETSTKELPYSLTMDANKNLSEPPRLHFSSVDPYAYHHPSTKKVVHFDSTIREIESTSPSRSSRTLPRTPPRTPPRNSTIPQSNEMNELKCFGCGSPGHFKRNCPKSPRSPSSLKNVSGNESTPSPFRQ